METGVGDTVVPLHGTGVTSVHLTTTSLLTLSPTPIPSLRVTIKRRSAPPEGREQLKGSRRHALRTLAAATSAVPLRNVPFPSLPLATRRPAGAPAAPALQPRSGRSEALRSGSSASSATSSGLLEAVIKLL